MAAEDTPFWYGETSHDSAVQWNKEARQDMTPAEGIVFGWWELARKAKYLSFLSAFEVHGQSQLRLCTKVARYLYLLKI